ncbi:MAG: hypothetical protein AB7S72_16240 [Draconibacterium sp.]
MKFILYPNFQIRYNYNRKQELTKTISIKIQNEFNRDLVNLNTNIETILKFTNCVEKEFEFIDKYLTKSLLKILANKFPEKIMYRNREYCTSIIEGFHDTSSSNDRIILTFTFGLAWPSGHINEMFRKNITFYKIWPEEKLTEIILRKIYDEEDEIDLITYDSL